MIMTLSVAMASHAHERTEAPTPMSRKRNRRDCTKHDMETVIREKLVTAMDT